MKIDEVDWVKLRGQIHAGPFVSRAAVELVCARPLAELEARQAIRFESKRLDESYLDFLEEQIALEARGPEWKVLLQARRDALGPYVGKELGCVTISGPQPFVWVKFDPQSLRVVWVEAHGDKVP